MTSLARTCIVLSRADVERISVAGARLVPLGQTRQPARAALLERSWSPPPKRALEATLDVGAPPSRRSPGMRHETQYTEMFGHDGVLRSYELYQRRPGECRDHTPCKQRLENGVKQLATHTMFGGMVPAFAGTTG